MDTTTPTPNQYQRNLPSWIWLAALLILHAGSQISVLFKIDEGISGIYLPTAIGIVLVNWWGPVRVVPMVYTNAVLSSFLWEVEDISNWFIFSIPEAGMVLLSWYLFNYRAKGQYWLPDIKSLLLFLTLGIIIPIIPELFLLHFFFVKFGSNPPEAFWFDIIRNCLGEFTSSFGISLILLYYVTPLMERASLTMFNYKIYIKRIGLTRWQWIEVIVLAIILLISVFNIEFKKYWYFYGVFSLFTAIRGGFGIAILVNFYIYLITYILPSLFPWYGNINLRTDKDTVYIFLGIGMLYVFAAVTGRIFSDLKGVERKLRGQYQQLEVANAELDRFVYSVSHDLSAPLKSILGLVNLGPHDVSDKQSLQYFTRIKSSVVKMEMFIGEILDYSRSKRQEIRIEPIDLKKLCNEIFDNLKFIEGAPTIRFDTSGIEVNEITTDRTRLKIILNNLIANAIHYQRANPDHQPFIKITSRKETAKFIIVIEDNGEGIKPEYLQKIFDMFYRATEKSKGSGLGLYIAKEAADKIKAILKIESTYGVGTSCKLLLPVVFYHTQ